MLTRGTLLLAGGMITATMVATLGGVLAFGHPIGTRVMRVGARLSAAGGGNPLFDAAEADAIVRALAVEAVTTEVQRQRPALAWPVRAQAVRR